MVQPSILLIYFARQQNPMPRIFNIIRQRLLKENLPDRQAGRLARYLVYAIGEILLVVIGILIALQVNTWNNTRQERRLERSILREMRENLRKDLAMNEKNLALNQARHDANSRVLEHLEQRTPFDPSLRQDYANLLGRGITTPNTSALDHLRGHGFGLIRNDALRQAITNLYLERYAYIRREEDGLDEHYHNERMLPLVMAHLRTERMFSAAEPRDVEALFDDKGFHEALRLNIQLRGLMAHNSARNVELIEALIGLIDGELSEP